jgi:hypothetical protein
MGAVLTDWASLDFDLPRRGFVRKSTLKQDALLLALSF